MKQERVRFSAASSASHVHRADDEPANDFLSKSFEEKPIWAGLYDSLRDVLFPPRLPPLELTSTPIPTPDRMAVRTNPWAFGTATIANGCIVAMLILLGLSSPFHPPPNPPPVSNLHLSDFTLFAPLDARAAKGGPGGGANEPIDPIMGRPPRRDNMPLANPQVPVLENPKLAIDPAVPLDVRLPDDPTLPNIGVHKSPNVTWASNGPGTDGGIGIGMKGGVGPGSGPGYGSVNGPGNSIYRAGVGGVTNPFPIVSPEAEFSDEARREKYQGVCMIAVIVDARGYPQNPRVIQSLGLGLDEKALDAVLRYRFKPAMRDGKPVPVMITVEVNFRLY